MRVMIVSSLHEKDCHCPLQDAHELLLDLINAVSEQLEAEEKARGDRASLPQQQNGTPAGTPQPTPRTWVHDLFQVRSHSYLTLNALNCF